MKKINIILLMFFSLSFLLSSCYKKETTWLEENADLSGEHYPQVSSFQKITEGDEFYIGDEVQFEMNFWSRDPIASTSLIVNNQEYDKQVYAPAFSSQTNMDSIVYTYTVPDLDVDKVTVKGKVVNENGLEKESGGIELKIVH